MGSGGRPLAANQSGQRTVLLSLVISVRPARSAGPCRPAATAGVQSGVTASSPNGTTSSPGTRGRP